MYSVIRRKRRIRDEDLRYYEGFEHHPKFSHASWVAVAVGGGALLGAGATIYGANKQADSNAAAQQANQAQQQQQNNAAWTNWLMSKGVAPTAPVAAGVMPQPGGYTAVNTRLPLWANVNMPTAPTPAASVVPLVVRRKG